MNNDENLEKLRKKNVAATKKAEKNKKEDDGKCKADCVIF